MGACQPACLTIALGCGGGQMLPTLRQNADVMRRASDKAVAMGVQATLFGVDAADVVALLRALRT